LDILGDWIFLGGWNLLVDWMFLGGWNLWAIGYFWVVGVLGDWIFWVVESFGRLD
jgi:hypothetical protein